MNYKICLKTVAFTLFFTTWHTSVFAESPLEQTQKILTDAYERAKIIQSDPNAKKVDDSIRDLFSSSNSQQQLYSLSSEIFGELVKSTNGDISKLQAIVEEAKNNPKAFYEKLSNENKNKIFDLSKSVRNPAKATP